MSPSVLAHRSHRTRAAAKGAGGHVAPTAHRLERVVRTIEPDRALQLAALVQQSDDGIILKSGTGLIEEWNAGAQRLYGYSAAEVVGQAISILVPAERQGEEQELLNRALSGQTVRVETRRLRSDGRVIDVSLVVSPIEDASGRIIAASAIAREITERKQVEAELRFLADHDPLTGLANRRVFEEQLESHIAQVRRYGSSGALLMLDIDHFKRVNDTLGHRAGDRLIAALARVLRERLRHTDTLARLGGDEFAVLLPRAGAAEAARLAAALVEAVRTHAGTGSGLPELVTTSVGVTVFDGELDGLCAETALAQADAAMYAAKQAGGDGYAFHAG